MNFLKTWTTHARTTRPIDHAENGVVHCSCVKNRPSTLEMSGRRETIARHPCTPPLLLEAFNEKISASTGSSIEIAVEEEKENDDTKIVKSV